MLHYKDMNFFLLDTEYHKTIFDFVRKVFKRDVYAAAYMNYKSTIIIYDALDMCNMGNEL